jgi:hypothetical protein
MLEKGLINRIIIAAKITIPEIIYTVFEKNGLLLFEVIDGLFFNCFSITGSILLLYIENGKIIIIPL